MARSYTIFDKNTQLIQPLKILNVAMLSFVKLFVQLIYSNSFILVKTPCLLLLENVQVLQNKDFITTFLFVI